MGDDRGGISVAAIILVFAAALIVASMGNYNLLEHRLTDKSMAHKSLGLMAETAARQEYEKLILDSELLEAIVNEHRPFAPSGNVLEDDRGHCEIFVGEGNGGVIIWAVAEKGSDKAQVCYLLSFDEDVGQFVLKGMF